MADGAATATKSDSRREEARLGALRDSRTASGKRRPRIAFTGEEFGFGYQATTEFVFAAHERDGFVYDGGYSVVPKTQNIKEITARESKRDRFGFTRDNELRQPLRSKEQALLAVKSNTADFALVPFYSPYFGYDFEALRALSNLFGMLAVEQHEATDQLCLAVHESQVLEVAQSSHPASGFSALLRRGRTTWTEGGEDFEEGRKRYPDFHSDRAPSLNFKAGLNIDRAAQMLLRDRIDMVFAGPEAARRCKSKLDGLRAAGVEIAEIPQSIEPHREMARRARATLSSERQVNTFFDPSDGKTHYVSSMNAEQQASRLFGIVLPFQVADMSSEFIIIDDNVEDAEPTKTRFFLVREAIDETLIEDAYKTTDARTRYWEKRLAAVSHGPDVDRLNPAHTLPGMLRFVFLLMFIVGAAAFLAGGIDIATAWLAKTFLAWVPVMNLAGLQPVLTTQGLFYSGAITAAASYACLTMRKRGKNGVRLMVRLQRSGAAASAGDVENYLRTYGVSHAIVRLDEDSEREAPAAIVLDIEFEPKDFAYYPWTIWRRGHNSVVNGALKKIFARWKNRSVGILAAVPFAPSRQASFFDDAEDARLPHAQLPKHKPRRWWSEGLWSWIRITAETIAIRAERVLLPILIFVLFALAVVYAYFPDLLPAWLPVAPAR